MSKFNVRNVKAPVTQAGTTTGETVTYEGGKAWTRDNRSELLLLAVSNMVGESTFYETADSRDARFGKLVREVAVQDSEWILGFVGWLRGEANMRSASVVAACEAVKARLDAKTQDEARNFRDFNFNAPGVNRKIIDVVCQRPDEPGEVLAYWTSRYGRNLPQPVKRGVADAAARLYSGKSLIKYDSAGSGVRFGDVLELTHAKPAPDKPWQGDLFKYAIDVRHRGNEAVTPISNETLTSYRILMNVPVAERRALLLDGHGPARLQSAGMTWEALAGWLQGPMDAKAWEAIIPSMGAMALVRNLRNFDEARVSDKVAARVCEKLSDPETIRKSRMFPYRMLAAYREAPSLRWGHALDKALDAACLNVPALEGKTLVVVDTSGSMINTVSTNSKIRHVDVGALFGIALAKRGNGVDLVGFADGVFPHNIVKGGSALREIESFVAKIGSVGHGTQTVAAIKASFVPGVHKRVVVISDEQAFASVGWIVNGGGRYFRGDIGSVSDAVPADVPLFGVTTTGYARSSFDTSKPNRFELGGYSDALFKIMGILASGRSVNVWPWQV